MEEFNRFYDWYTRLGGEIPYNKTDEVMERFTEKSLAVNEA